MKNILVKTILPIYMLLNYQPTWANSTNYWQCTTTDAENKIWVIESNYQLTAINQSFAACKKESAYPKTCKASKNSCEHFINGQTTRPMWRCTALDRMANRWPSNIYNSADDAALAAKAYCKDKSSVPYTCYVNMISCENINAQNAMGE